MLPGDFDVSAYMVRRCFSCGAPRAEHAHARNSTGQLHVLAVTRPTCTGFLDEIEHQLSGNPQLNPLLAPLMPPTSPTSLTPAQVALLREVLLEQCANETRPPKFARAAIEIFEKLVQQTEDFTGPITAGPADDSEVFEVTEDEIKELIDRARALLTAATPGPWHASDDAEPVRVVAGAMAGYHRHGSHFVCGHEAGGYAHPVSPADAALIAAAPELLTALCDALERCGC